MIDAYQATTIAAMGEGAIVHYRAACVGSAWNIASEEWKADGEKPGEFELHLEAERYEALSRYTIHELESVNWDDLAYSVDFEMPKDLEDWGPNRNVSWEDKTVIDPDGVEHDVSAYVNVYCDQCGERIE